MPKQISPPLRSKICPQQILSSLKSWSVPCHAVATDCTCMQLHLLISLFLNCTGKTRGCVGLWLFWREARLFERLLLCLLNDYYGMWLQPAAATGNCRLCARSELCQRTFIVSSGQFSNSGHEPGIGCMQLFIIHHHQCTLLLWVSNESYPKRAPTIDCTHCVIDVNKLFLTYTKK